MFDFVVANLAANLLVAVVDDGAHVLSIQRGCHFFGIVVELLRDRQHHHLVGGEPEREVAGGVFDEHGNETFH